MSTPYTAPKFHANAFNCPFCNAYAHFYWGMFLTNNNQNSGHWGAKCSHCNQWTVWVNSGENNVLVFPKKITAPLPSLDMPENCRADFEEARNISAESPKAAAALLRLIVQKLCVHFGEPGKNLNEDIGSLVKKGLDSKIQRALDIVRVTGNHSLHPGEMSVEDNPEIASRLFEVVNMIVYEMITKPNELARFYGELPEKERDKIQKRDSKPHTS